MAEPRTFTSADELKAAVGEPLGYSDWLEVDQKRIDLFAEATGDHQWIHVDPERAASGPFGSTIAHGYLTLSLIPRLLPEIVECTGFGMVVNYGCERVRFPSPVPVGSKVRLTATLTNIEDIAGGKQLTFSCVIEREGGDKPVCIAEPVYRYYGG